MPPLSTTGPREGPSFGVREGAEMGKSTILIQRIKRIGPLLVSTVLENLVQNFHLISARSLFLVRTVYIMIYLSFLNYSSAFGTIAALFEPITAGFFLWKFRRRLFSKGKWDTKFPRSEARLQSADHRW